MSRIGSRDIHSQRWRSWTTTLVVLVALATPALGEDVSETMLVELAPINFTEAIKYLEETHTDIAGRNWRAGTIEVVIHESRLHELWTLGEVSILGRSRPFKDIVAERVQAGAVPDPNYKTYGEVLAWMDDVEAKNPSIVQKVNLTQRYGTPPTEEGREMFAIKISDNVTQDEDELSFLFDSLHHARELNTIEVTMDIVNILVDVYGKIPGATKIVDAYEIWVVPVVNPDGLEYVWNVNNNWRKNRRDNLDGTFGVDINRNYPFLWGVCGNNSGNTNSEVYRGPFELSEPEAQTMVALGEEIRPTIYNSYHSSGQEVLPPYVCANLAESAIVNAVRDKYRERMDYDWRFASSSGESFEWFYNQVSSVGYLTEIGTSFQPPFEITEEEVLRVRPGWIWLLQVQDIGPLVQGLVTDSVTGQPIVAEVSSNRINFTEGERRACEPQYGRYGWLLPLEGHTLTFSAEGYASEEIDTFVTLGGVTIDVELDPQP